MDRWRKTSLFALSHTQTLNFCMCVCIGLNALEVLKGCDNLVLVLMVRWYNAVKHGKSYREFTTDDSYIFYTSY